MTGREKNMNMPCHVDKLLSNENKDDKKVFDYKYQT